MHSGTQDVLLPTAAIALALLLFGGFVALAGVSPADMWLTLFKGAFGTWFAWQNTLQRAAPLMLTALCVALPARAGLIVIGGEGALVLGGLACAALPMLLPLPDNLAGTVLVCAAGALAGAAWVVLAGGLRQYRGINETISSLLLAYVATQLGSYGLTPQLWGPQVQGVHLDDDLCELLWADMNLSSGPLPDKLATEPELNQLFERWSMLNASALTVHLNSLHRTALKEGYP